MPSVTAFLVFMALFFVLISLQSWRTGMLLCIILGFLQDPIRKLMPSEPVWLSAIVIVGAAIPFTISAINLTGRMAGSMFGRHRELVWLVWFFILLVFVQAVLAYLNFGVAIVAIIGLIAYLSPMPAMWLSFTYPRSIGDVSQFLLVYGGCAVVVGATAVLSFVGIDSILFKEIGEGLTIYGDNGAIKLHVGLARSPEVLAWHAATASCVLITLSVATKVRSTRLAAMAAAGFLLAVGLLTARRKMFVEVTAFIALFPLLLMYFKNFSGQGAMLSMVAFAGGTGFLLLSGGVDFVFGTNVSDYLNRGESLSAQEVMDRFSTLGFSSIEWALEQVGWFGLGAGTGSQGVQHFVGVGGFAGGAAEGGLGKIAIELGLPGILMIGALLWRGAVYMHASLRDVSAINQPISTLMVGLLTWLIINGVAFLAATQIYGDPFVLLMLGWFVGFILSAPRLARVATPTPEPAGVRYGPPLRAF